MMLPTLTPLTPHLGYEVQGVDLSQPLSPALRELLRGAMGTRGLLLFRNQDIGDEQQVEFARVFGRISRQGPIQKKSPPATYVSNVRPDGAFGDVELAFHSDQVYFEHPMKAIMLYAIEVPEEGGDTLFSSSAGVVERMPASLKDALSKAMVTNRLDYGALKFGSSLKGDVAAEIFEARQPALTRHEFSQLPIHLISPDTTKEVDGHTPEESEALVAQVHALVADERYVYRHRWRVGDLIVWDNTLLQHARTPFLPSSRRTLRRCAIGSDHEPAEA